MFQRRSEVDGMSTQKEDVLNYARGNGSITHREAEDELGVMRLAARIHELEKLGYKFKHEMIPFKSRRGRKSHFARYSLEA